jgi:rubredoxin
MRSYICTICDYVYDQTEEESTERTDLLVPFEDLSGDWTCPVCSARKRDFKPFDVLSALIAEPGRSRGFG